MFSDSQKGNDKTPFDSAALSSEQVVRKNFSREQMNETIPLCRECHNACHKFVPREKELGRHFHSLELLKSHPQIAKFAQWASRQK